MTAEKQVPDRNLAMELVRVTEAAALAGVALDGPGRQERAPTAPPSTRCASSCRRCPMDGIVVIGEGEKDEAPMLYNGEQIGDGTPPETDIAVDPIDGTTLTVARPGQRDLGHRGERAGHDVRPGPLRLHGEDRGRARRGAASIDITQDAHARTSQAVAKAKARTSATSPP